MSKEMTQKELLIELLRSYTDVEEIQFPAVGKLDDVFGQFLSTEPTKKEFQGALYGVVLTSGMLWEIMHYKKNSGGD